MLISQVKLQKDIAETVKMCDQSLFIFDEVDKMPEGVLDAVKPYLDHHHHISGVDYRRTIFIFLRYKIQCECELPGWGWVGVENPHVTYFDSPVLIKFPASTSRD